MEFLRSALKGQYRAGLAMLRNCIEVCPDDLWPADEHPRAYWRITYHTVFYTHLYLMPEEAAFKPWEKHSWHGPVLWLDEEEGVPPIETTYTRAELIEYVDMVDGMVGEWVDALDLESQSSGFHWYKIPKLDHQLVNIRHLGLHVGQLQ